MPVIISLKIRDTDTPEYNEKFLNQVKFNQK